MLLIVESAEFRKPRKVSSSSGKIIFEAILHTADTPNKNGRIYPLNVMKQAVQALKPSLPERIFGGELDHPLPTEDQYYSTIRHMTLSLKEMSHVFTDLWFEDNKLIGKGETLATPNGKIMASLIEEGVHLGFSLRGFTDNLERNGEYDVVQPPLVLRAIDAVATPSHEEAKLRRVSSIKESDLSNVGDPNTKQLLEAFFEIKKSINKTVVGNFFSSKKYSF